MFDISKFEDVEDTLNKGLPFEPRHPVTDEPMGATWQVASYQSDAYKASERIARTQGLKSLRTGKVSASKMDESEIDLLSSLVLSWTGMKDGGLDLPCTPENVKNVLNHPVVGVHLRKQLDDHASDNEAFFKASGKPSPMPLNTKSDT